MTTCQLELQKYKFPYTNQLSLDNLDYYLKRLSKKFTAMTTKKRNIPMYVFGSTTGPSKTPMFEHNGKLHMLPRPFVNNRPGKQGKTMIGSEYWFVHLLQFMERITLWHVWNVYINKEEFDEYGPIHEDTIFCKEKVPKCLRVFDTMFTQVSLLFHENDDPCQIPPHVDEQDLISCVLTLGSVDTNTQKVNGATVYYSDLGKNKGCFKMKEVEFKHGQIQITTFDKVLHGTNYFEQGRYTINANIKKGVIQHFRDHGNRYYQQFIDAGYTKKHFVAK